MIVKQLIVQCTECGWTEEFSDCDIEWDAAMNMESCPECLKRVADAV